MLAIDAAFFVLELGVGLFVGSLALMADAFHMVSCLDKKSAQVLSVLKAKRHNIVSGRTLGCESCPEVVYRQILLRGQYELS